ncbi:MAG: hypothetical protein WCJ05_01050 [bacterium]
MMLKKIKYTNLNARQKENYNFQKIAATLAEYGYSCMWLNDDWQGADFIANHIDGVEFLKVQLKGRLTINKKYIGKDIYVAFRHEDDTYLYPHDELMTFVFKELPNTEKGESWVQNGGFSWPNPMPKKLEQELVKYKLF